MKIPVDKIEALAKQKKKEKLLRTVPARPEGSFTTREYAEQVGLDRANARTRLNVLVESGDLIPVKIPIVRSNGTFFYGPGFILKQKKSK